MSEKVNVAYSVNCSATPQKHCINASLFHYMTVNLEYMYF